MHTLNLQRNDCILCEGHYTLLYDDDNLLLSRGINEWCGLIEANLALANHGKILVSCSHGYLLNLEGLTPKVGTMGTHLHYRISQCLSIEAIVYITSLDLDSYSQDNCLGNLFCELPPKVVMSWLVLVLIKLLKSGRCNIASTFCH